MNNPTSHSDTLNKTVRRFFIPSLADFILYLLLSALVLLGVNHQTVWNTIHTDTVAPTDVAKAVLSQRFELVGQTLNAPIFGRLSLLLFWAFIGCVTYMILWLVQFMLTTAREDYVEGQQYVHPKAFDKKTYWRSIFAHNIFLFSAIVVFLGFLYFSLRIFLPVLSKLFSVGIYILPSVNGFVDILAALLLVGFLFYTVPRLWQIVRTAWLLNSVPVSD